jgi:23S rRNA (adenine2503-C2)-methyltransferase
LNTENLVIKKRPFYALTFKQLSTVLEEQGLNPQAANLYFNWHYKKKNTGPCLVDIAKKTSSYISKNYHFDLPKISFVQESEDKTVKFLFELKDGSTVESVLIPFHKKYSLCVSSQVGCAMKCSFCFTGTQGLKRSLSVDEITGQFLGAWQWLVENRKSVDSRILNIVFMGQGEPLHNFDSIKNACEIFLDKHGTSMAHQKITISTSGYIPGLKRWAAEIPGVNLALSLHSTNTEIRNELIPINNKYPLSEVMGWIDGIPLAKKQFITYEYLLIDSLNDSEEDAHGVGKLLATKPAYINLIPFNPFPGSNYKRPALEKIERFKSVLDTYKIPTLIRGTKGDDVLAACGQLNTK